jgi:hypothetical protein
MKLRFHYLQQNEGHAASRERDLRASCDTGEPRQPEWFDVNAKFTPEQWGRIGLARPYAAYLFSALRTDFPEHSPEFCEEVMNAVERLERDEIDKYIWEGDGFTHTLTHDKVVFEHTIFGECPEWPIWSCPLSHYKAALLGWRRFIEMPEAIGTELIVELPD